MALILKNGFVFDPKNKVKGEKKDIFIDNNGIIVDRLSGKDAKVIDCSGKTVMPGGVEIHSHLAGGKVNVGRMLRPEDHLNSVVPRTKITRCGSGFSTPSTFITGYKYAQMGYTTAMTAAIPPLMARHTHEEIHDIPMMDIGGLTLMGNNWFILEYLKNGDTEKAAAFVAWLLKAAKGYAIKVVNPGGSEAWGWGKDVRNLDQPTPHFDITPREIIKGLTEVNEMLGLPHGQHLHTNNLGRAGNFETTLDTMKIPNGTKASGDRQPLHITHAQFHSYGGDSWKTFESKADMIAKEVNQNDNVMIDMGQVTMDETTTMTADGPMEYYLSSLTRLKWTNKNIELETAPGVTPEIYSKSSPVNSVQWAIGLELALLVDDPWKVLLTTDHPNGGPFTRYPRIIAWLMSKESRNKFSSELHKALDSRSIIQTLDREMDLYEIATITRAGQAKALGMANKGHLGAGANGDVAVFDINPENLDTRDYMGIEKAFGGTAYTIKDGQIGVKDGEIVKVINGRTMYVDAKVDSSLARDVLKDIEYKFKRYYSVNMANYPVQEGYLTRPTPIGVDASHIK